MTDEKVVAPKLFRSYRILEGLKRMAVEKEKEAKRYEERRDSAKDPLEHEFWKAAALCEHHDALQIMAYADEFLMN